MNLIVATALEKSYGKLKAVNGVSLNVPAGSCVAVLGPNGAGKTTFMEMLEGLQPPDSGSIEIFGLTYAKDAKEIYERVGVILQETSLYKRFTVRETLELFASFFSKRTDLDKLIERLGLTDKKDTRLHKLSGGQKQRVYIGCALVNDPELIFLDEPTSGLDPQARHFVWDLLLNMKSKGKSLLLTTHFMDEAAYLADQVAIMDHGTIIAQGSVPELLKKYGGDPQFYFDYQDLNTNEADIINAACAKHKITPIDFSKRGSATVTVAEPAQFLADLVPALAQLGAKISQLGFKNRTLEDVFLHLTGRKLRDL